MTIADLLSLEKAAKEAFETIWLGYTHTQGDPELRQDISEIYSKITLDDLTFCTGAQEPIFLFPSYNGLQVYNPTSILN